MDKNIENNELELMRKQLEILKNKLSSQEIVNNRLMREAMRHKMSWIRKFIWAEVIAIPFIMLMFIFIRMIFDWSWWLYAFIMLVIILDVCCDFKVNRIRSNDWTECELLDMSRRLARMNKLRLIQLAAGVAMIVVVFVWACFDTVIPSGELEPFVRSCAVGACVGAVIGAAIGTWTVWKMNKTNKQIIKEIDEITKSNK